MSNFVFWKSREFRVFENRWDVKAGFPKAARSQITCGAGEKIAKIAIARKLSVHLYWMWRQGWEYQQLPKLGLHAREPGNRHGVQ